MIIVINDEGAIEIEGVVLKDMTDLRAYIGAHQPASLSVTVGAHRPSDLAVSFGATWSIVGQDIIRFYAQFDMHKPIPLSVDVGITHPSSLLVNMQSWHYRNFNIMMRAFKSTYRNIYVSFKGVHSTVGDLYVALYGWRTKNLNIKFSSHAPISLATYFQTYHALDFSLILSTVFPTAFTIEFASMPESGVDLQVVHRTSKFSNLNVFFHIWTFFSDLSISLHGVYKNDLSVLFRMGGYYPLSLPIPMTTGYKTLEVMFQPSYRIVNTLLAVYTVESKNLYVSINQGWPCGFGSSYKLLSVSFLVRYVHAFNIIFKVIWGSGTLDMKTFINRTDFKSYLASFGITLDLPVSPPPSSPVPYGFNTTYNNDFKEVYMNRVRVKFSWPRLLRECGYGDFSLELFAYLEDKILDFAVSLYALRPMPPILPSSQPVVVTGGLDDPQMPLVYQVREIQLWNLDPPGLVRKIDVMFGGHIKEYFWVSDEQRAYRSDLYTEWSYLTKGFVPDAEYSGQISSMTLRELSDVRRYPTVDSAIKALLTNFTHESLSVLKLSIIPSGGYSGLNLLMNVWGRDRLKDFQLLIQPFHTSALNIEFNCQEF